MRRNHRKAQDHHQRRTKPLDEAVSHCENIEALGSLLAHYSASEGMQDATVNHSGYMILAETEKLQAVLHALAEWNAQR